MCTASIGLCPAGIVVFTASSDVCTASSGVFILVVEMCVMPLTHTHESAILCYIWLWY